MAQEKVKFLDVKLLAASGQLMFILGNGTKIAFDPKQCNEETKERAMFHGFNQKIRDSAAGFSKEKDFAGAEAEMRAVIDSLYANEWNRKGGAGTGVVLEDLAHAIARFKKVDFDRALAAVSKATPEQRAEWGKHKVVAAFAAQAKADRLNAAATAADSGDVEIPDLE